MANTQRKPERSRRKVAAQTAHGISVQPWPHVEPMPKPRAKAMHDAAELLDKVDALAVQIEALGLGSSANEGKNGETKGEQAISSALHVVSVGLQQIGAWLKYGDEWPLYRDEFIRAANVIRGGANANRDRAPGHDKRAALASAQQALGRALGVGFAKHQDGFVDDVRQQFAAQFGAVFRDVPNDAVIQRHAEPTSGAARALAIAGSHRDGLILPATFYKAFDRAAMLLARDVLWAGYEEARRRGVIASDRVTSVDRSAFRFMMESGDTTARNFLKRLQRSL